jgi:hypothetical protein
MAVFEHNPDVDIAPAPDRPHSLHALVPHGVPEAHKAISVAGTAAAAAP